MQREEVRMFHASEETVDHEIEHQTRVVRGSMAALYSRRDADPDESPLREPAEARKMLRELEVRRDGEQTETEK
jgi:hypothetical protein